ncbi:MAG: hypothetical protein KC609_01400 [Myxococcales bacterium]|nr:hypothetical protein [Myxococcales bacterium]
MILVLLLVLSCGKNGRFHPLCDESSPCDSGLVCVNGRCVTTSQLGCNGGACNDVGEIDTPLSEPLPDSLVDPDCQTDEQCNATGYDRCAPHHRCIAGRCTDELTQPVSCDTSGDTTCRKNRCNPLSGQCEPQSVADGTPCDDGNLCTTNTRCQSGACTGDAVDCTQGKTCATGSCDPTTGCQVDLSQCTCTKDSDCNDENPCNGVERCDTQSGTCTPDNSVKSCDGTTCIYSTDLWPCGDDGDPCTDDVCIKGLCSHALKTGQCAIGGQCVASGTVNPENPCQICDPLRSATGWSVNAGGVCNDNDLCTKDDVCLPDGSCHGVPKCSDSYDCTVDSCTNGTCKHELDGQSCLIDGSCHQTGDPASADASECRICNPLGTGGTSDWSVKPGSCLIAGVCYATGASNPTNKCELCDPSKSVTEWSPRSCDDGRACSFDSCDPTKGCTFDVSTCACSSDNECDDGEPCNGKERCNLQSGTCESDPSVKSCVGQSCTYTTDGQSCDSDAKSCTSDQCTDGACVHTLLAGSCMVDGVCLADGTLATNDSGECRICQSALRTDDWSLVAQTCRIDGVCYAANALNPQNKCEICKPSSSTTSWSPRSCSDGKSCTWDSCSPSLGCRFLANGSGCYIGGSCYSNNQVNPSNACEVCQQSSPSSWTARSCDDGKSCTSDSCNPSVGCTQSANGNGCYIGGACYSSGTTNPSSACQVCDATKPTSWSSKSCDDGISCTDDLCDAASGCKHPVKSGSCLIGGVCYANGALNPQNKCQVCNASASATSWSTRSCQDGLSCTADTCDPTVGCLFSANGQGCYIDGSCYTSNQKNPSNSCEVCKSAKPTKWSVDNTLCDDGLDCTTDSCDTGTQSCKNVYNANSGKCLIAGACYSGGEKNPQNKCQSCDPSRPKTWSGTACPLGQTCNPSWGTCGTTCSASKPCGPCQTCFGGWCTALLCLQGQVCNPQSGICEWIVP